MYFLQKSHLLVPACYGFLEEAPLIAGPKCGAVYRLRANFAALFECHWIHRVDKGRNVGTSEPDFLFCGETGSRARVTN